MFKGISTRKIIAILFSGAFVLYSGYSLITGTAMPDTFTVICTSVMGYYFGKSTALDTPNKI